MKIWCITIWYKIINIGNYCATENVHTYIRLRRYSIQEMLKLLRLCLRHEQRVTERHAQKRSTPSLIAISLRNGSVVWRGSNPIKLLVISTALWSAINMMFQAGSRANALVPVILHFSANVRGKFSGVILLQSHVPERALHWNVHRNQRGQCRKTIDQIMRGNGFLQQMWSSM